MIFDERVALHRVDGGRAGISKHLSLIPHNLLALERCLCLSLSPWDSTLTVQVDHALALAPHARMDQDPNESFYYFALDY